jgi:spermidine synthase
MRMLPLPVLAIAFLSGLASLVYQINWQRDLTIVFGVSHYATTSIILAFFLGFALGAYVAKRVVDRVRRRFLLVASIEGAIALFGIASPVVFDLVQGAARSLSLVSDQPVFHLGFLRGLLAVAAILIPTTCMGMTLPAFYKIAVTMRDDRGRRIGLVTAANTLGAVAGSLLTTFVLMGRYPGRAQILLAVSLNLVSAIIALACLRAAPADATSDARRPTSAGDRPVHGRRLLLAYSMSGAAALGLEIVWNRLVYLSLDHTFYTFSLTLTTYLTGYALGSLLGGRLTALCRPSRNMVALLLLLIVLTTVLGLRVYHGGHHANDLKASIGYFPGAILITYAFLFLPSLFMGMAMPPTLHLLTAAVGDLGRDTGRAQLVNNVGSVLAVVTVGYVLLPRVGLYPVVLFCLSLVACALLLLVEPLPPGQLPRHSSLAGAVVLLALCLFAVPSALHSGHEARFYRNAEVLREDASGVWGIDRVRPQRLVLRLNGYFENSLRLPPRGIFEGDFLIPVLFHPDSLSVYMVGLGFGIGAYELLQLETVERFEAAELSPVAIELSRDVWGRFGGGFFADPRFHLVREDGRVHLESSDRLYDVIISGTNRPFYAGSTHIYSLEYWRMVAERLADGGVFMQWLPLYSEESALLLLRTFSEVFPKALVVRHTQYVYMLGFAGPVPPLGRDAFARARGRLPAAVRRAAFFSPDALLGRTYRIDAERLSQRFPLNRDDFPACEYSFRGFENERSIPAAAIDTVFGEYLAPIDAGRSPRSPPARR